MPRPWNLCETCSQKRKSCCPPGPGATYELIVSETELGKQSDVILISASLKKKGKNMNPSKIPNTPDFFAALGGLSYFTIAFKKPMKKNWIKTHEKNYEFFFNQNAKSAERFILFLFLFLGLHCFGPTVDLVRDPRWGRIKRTFGEDPYLTGSLVSVTLSTPTQFRNKMFPLPNALVSRILSRFSKFFFYWKLPIRWFLKPASKFSYDVY